jgi:hypothetical protein
MSSRSVHSGSRRSSPRSSRSRSLTPLGSTNCPYVRVRSSITWHRFLCGPPRSCKRAHQPPHDRARLNTTRCGGHRRVKVSTTYWYAGGPAVCRLAGANRHLKGGRSPAGPAGGRGGPRAGRLRPPGPAVGEDIRAPWSGARGARTGWTSRRRRCGGCTRTGHSSRPGVSGDRVLNRRGV